MRCERKRGRAKKGVIIVVVVVEESACFTRKERGDNYKTDIQMQTTKCCPKSQTDMSLFFSFLVSSLMYVCVREPVCTFK